MSPRFARIAFPRDGVDPGFVGPPGPARFSKAPTHDMLASTNLNAPAIAEQSYVLGLDIGLWCSRRLGRGSAASIGCSAGALALWPGGTGLGSTSPSDDLRLGMAAGTAMAAAGLLAQLHPLVIRSGRVKPVRRVDAA